MSLESSGKPDAWKLARPVWGWGRGATPRPTPRDGYAIWMKRLEQGTLEVPRADDPKSSSLQITASELSLILEGIELSSVRRRKRFRLRSAG